MPNSTLPSWTPIARHRCRRSTPACSFASDVLDPRDKRVDFADRSLEFPDHLDGVAGVVLHLVIPSMASYADCPPVRPASTLRSAAPVTAPRRPRSPRSSSRGRSSRVRPAGAPGSCRSAASANSGRTLRPVRSRCGPPRWRPSPVRRPPRPGR